jgi:hypothetical protein
MNMRVVLYGGVGAVLVFALTGGESGGSGEGAALALNLRQQAAYNNECMKEVVGFELSMQGKLKYCGCVVDDFQARINKNEKLLERHKAFVAKYLEMKGTPRVASRSLASASEHIFSTSSAKLDILFSSMILRYDFPEVRQSFPELAKDVEGDWKASMIACTELKPANGKKSR